MAFETILLWVAVLLFVSVVSSKLSDKLAVPVLLFFLAIGMLAGSEGIGKVYFDDAQLARSIGLVALIFIVFSGGCDTNWKETKTVLYPGILLSTVGVLITAFVIGVLTVYILKFSLLQGMLLGSIIASTDAPAVFTILRSKRINLKSPLKPLLEFESGSNDPISIFLTLGFIDILTQKMSIWALIPKFFIDMGVGTFVGFLMAKLVLFIVRRIKLYYEGLYPVMMIALVLFTYAVAVFLKGNGILAVYLLGLMLAKADFTNKRTILKFHDGLAWFMQITMFITLGLLVFPSRILPFVGAGLLVTLIMMFLARPIGVFLCLLPFKMNLRKKTLIAWVGLSGSAPIIMATFPFAAGIPQADTIFNMVFFVVIFSVLLQGTSIPIVSKMLKVDLPLVEKTHYPIEFEKVEGIDAELTDLIVPYNSEAIGKTIRELNVPEKCLIMLISRNDKFVIPAGSTVIQGGDVLLVLANTEDFSTLHQTMGKIKKEDG